MASGAVMAGSGGSAGGFTPMSSSPLMHASNSGYLNGPKGVGKGLWFGLGGVGGFAGSVLNGGGGGDSVWGRLGWVLDRRLAVDIGGWGTFEGGGVGGGRLRWGGGGVGGITLACGWVRG